MALYGIVSTGSTRDVLTWTRANVPGFNDPSAFGMAASKVNARVCVFTAGLIRDIVPVIALPGNASIATATGCPAWTQGAIRSGISPTAFRVSMRTIVITGAWL